jgi:glycosyltransferase involved in cell wall biosynthesis
MAALSIDVIVPTYNRARFLRDLLDSVVCAPIPPNLTVTVTVVDNNSTDDTRATVEEVARYSARPVRYVVETASGKSAALNTGISQTAGDVVAFLDDDEVVAPSWFECLARVLGDERIDFVSGRCLTMWGAAEPPGWLPRAYPAVIGGVDGGPRMLAFEREYDGTLSGGNSAVRRAVLARVGAFSTRLGPRAGGRLMSCEDEEIYLRLVDAGARGVYAPDLVVYHHVHPERVTRRYHRRWCFWRGVSKAVVYAGRPGDLPHVGGVPRFLYGAAARGLLAMIASPFGASALAARFNAELAVWDLAGFLYGRYLYRRNRAPEDRLGGKEAATESARCGVAAAG